jgi:hypothetical protein
MKLSPGLTVMRTTSQSESTRVPPVTELLKSPPAFADDRRALAGHGRFVDRGRAFDDLAITRDDVARPHMSTMSPLRRSVLRTARVGASCGASVGRLQQDLGHQTVPARPRLERRTACALPRPSAISFGKVREVAP